MASAVRDEEQPWRIARSAVSTSAFTLVDFLVAPVGTFSAFAEAGAVGETPKGRSAVVVSYLISSLVGE